MTDLEQIIRDSAARNGIDPEIAVRVARSEGLAPGVWQSNARKNGLREPSYGPFQLLVGGGDTGFPEGLGNAFIKATGLDPRDQATAPQQIDFALKTAAQDGWRQWYGAKNAGIGRWQGIKPGARSAADAGALQRAAAQPILGADARQAAVEQQIGPQQPYQPPAQAPVTADPGTSPLGAMLSGFMEGFRTPGNGPKVTQDDSPQVAMNAAALMDKGRQLKGAFAPDIAGLMSLGKRPVSV